MRARSLSQTKNKQRKREREKKKKTISQSSPRTSPRPFSFIYTWNPPSSGFLALVCNKTRETKGILASRFREKECALSPLSERERSEKRTAGLINTRPAHVPASTNRIESVAETPPTTIPSRGNYIPTSLLWLQIIMGGGSGAYFTTQVRLIVLPLFTNRSGAPMMMVIGSETKFFLFFFLFFLARRTKYKNSSRIRIKIDNINILLLTSVVIIFYNFDQEFLYYIFFRLV